MKIEKKAYGISENTFAYLAYALVFLFATLGHIPVLGGYLKVLSNFGIAMLVVVAVIKNRTIEKNKFIILVAFITLSFITIYKANYYGIFKLILLIAATKGISFRSLVKYDMWLRIVMAIMIVCLYKIGIAPDVIAIYPDGTQRHSFGFQNCNHIGMVLTIILFEYLYLCNMKVSWKRGILIGLIFVILDFMSGGRTAWIICIITLAFAVAYTYFPSFLNNKKIKCLAEVSPLILATITFISLRLFEAGNVWAYNLNTLASGRIGSIAYYDNLLGISILGKNIALGNRTLDNLYAYLFLCLGVIVFLLYMWLTYRLISEAYKKKNIPAVIIIVCFSIYGLSERLWMNVDYNLLMLMFRELLYHDVMQD